MKPAEKQKPAADLTLLLTIRQRLVLESLIRAEATDNEEQLALLVDLRRKIGFPPETRAKYVLELPQGIRFRDALVDAGPDITIAFERAELRRLVTLLKGRKYSTDDAETWYWPLTRQLTNLGFIA